MKSWGTLFRKAAISPDALPASLLRPIRGFQALHQLTESLIENVRVMKTTPPIAIIATKYNDLHAEIATYLAGALFPWLIF